MIPLLTFPFYYLKEIVMGTLSVAYDVIIPRSRSRISPVLLRIPIELESPRKRLLLASLITMTPGTLSVDEQEGGRILIVHSLYGGKNPEGTISEIKENYERIVARLPI